LIFIKARNKRTCNEYNNSVVTYAYQMHHVKLGDCKGRFSVELSKRA